MRWRVRRQTWATPGQNGARCSVMLAVASRQRVSIRPWPFSIVSACLRSGGGDHSAEGGIRPEGQRNVRCQRRLVVLHGEEIVAAAFGDDTTDLPLGKDGATGNHHPSSGSVFSSSSAAVISLASGATRNWPITPCNVVL